MNKKHASSEIRTHAGFLPADLESAALDRSAIDAVVAVLVFFVTFKTVKKAIGFLELGLKFLSSLV